MSSDDELLARTPALEPNADIRSMERTGGNKVRDLQSEREGTPISPPVLCGGASFIWFLSRACPPVKKTASYRRPTGVLWALHLPRLRKIASTARGSFSLHVLVEGGRFLHGSRDEVENIAKGGEVDKLCAVDGEKSEGKYSKRNILEGFVPLERRHVTLGVEHALEP
ncbi:uncharacterized protein BO97DRAFT_422791 [Aspergillus homomorphus CBS 101889]|uniref:Uncharacterized protein n=1 Tax=Aspergillus homomorphus (strain CBS 101889) TaxID=1450537 RepID=A0A395I889_ASPHC|nr:hypothetical protein BO97DRAFT_422791 [Aspergillus homomorphus CBS 101889]RAL14374.1 hypothetical protein BO97DRAFT_422791 [Aspergillus homomorphus CBS 101889]